jgi:hypothetical protein
MSESVTASNEKKQRRASPVTTGEKQQNHSRSRKVKAVSIPAPPKAPGPRERAAIENASARVQGRKKRVSFMEEREGGTLKIGPEHSDLDGYSYRLRDAFGTESFDFAQTEALRLSKALGPKNSNPASIEVLNAARAVVDGNSPENEVEAMLASQMAMTHALTMQAMMRSQWAEYQAEYQTAGNLAVKLSRTFTMQIEALAKLRRGGEQTVRVEHVHVHNGGQAIVGAISHPGGGGSPLEIEVNPMQRETREPLSLRLVPRCCAKTRSGNPCQSPKVRGRARCRMHGGAKGSGALKGRDNGRYQHGMFTCDAIKRRWETRALILEMRVLAEGILQ